MMNGMNGVILLSPDDFSINRLDRFGGSENLVNGDRRLNFTDFQAGSGNPTDYKIDSDINAVDFGPPVCFLAGTLISTVDGPKSIETIQPGDNVIVLKDGAKHVELVIWTGAKTVNICPSLPDDSAGYPVCVRKNALTDNVPDQDLFITAEHCLYFDGKLVPARMLVNDRSIFYAKNYGSHEIFHLETAQHSIISANNALTETYLDTGNRYSFQRQNGLGASSSKQWTKDAAAPLCTDVNFVETLWQTLDTRAGEIYQQMSARERRQLRVTKRPRPDLRLQLPDKTELEPEWEEQNVAVFNLPPRTQEVTVCSAIFRACDIYAPYVDDRRQLGVFVEKVAFFNATDQKIAEPECPFHGYGWWGHDASWPSWSNGRAILPIGGVAGADVAKLRISVSIDR